MRWLLLALLTLLAGLAAVAIALRSKPNGRAELALTTCIAWNALIGCPIYALGFAGHLRATTLAIVSGAFFSAVLAATAWRRPRQRWTLELAAGVVRLVTLPFAGIAIARRARSLVVLALLLATFLIVYTAIGSYFTPSWRQWDSPWYHETIIGFTIQNHGFGVVDLPLDLQKTNGYPRFCEMMDLWFVIFTDRRLIELTNSLVTPGLMFATYVVARRYTKDVLACMGWAAVIVLQPCVSYLLESTYIDIQVALFVMAATHYATRPVFRIVDAWLAAVCITLCVGSKVLALPPAAVIAMIALVRLVRHHRLGLRTLATVVGGLSLIVGMGASTYWRNWVHFKNPFWPDLSYDNPKYGIHLPFVQYTPDALDMNIPIKRLLQAMVTIPYSDTTLGAKGLLYDYGFAVTWIVFPFGALALVIITLLCLRDLIGRLVRLPHWRYPMAHNAMLVALPLVAQVSTSPALWASRYHIANVAALACLIAFCGGRPRWHALGEGASVAACVASVIVFFWVKPRWLWLPSEMIQLASIPYPEREVTPAAAISKEIWIASGSIITKEVGLEREKLKPGEIVAFTDNVGFPAPLWNNNFTNKLVWLPAGADYLARANAIGARWVHCRNGDATCASFAAPDSGWEDLGVYNVENWGHIYRRKAP